MSRPDVSIVIKIGFDKSYHFVGPWMSDQVMDVYPLLQIYNDMLTEKRDAAYQALIEVLGTITNHAVDTRSMLISLTVPTMTEWGIAAEPLPGAPDATGVQIHVRTMIRRTVS